ncbi:MAG TPA: CheR family methyltransferase [Dongiaceae bacterium]|nr:CheR family methyltransferase [Dongiaceae bacterium]
MNSIDLSSAQTEDVELKRLLEGILLHSGFDFLNYNRPALKDRVLAFLRQEQLDSISGLQAAVLRDAASLDRLLLGLATRQTALFSEPSLYRVLRQDIVPWLRTYPFPRLWVAGCAGGAEAYSLAIILLEETLQDRCRLYATDLCEAVVRQARAGVWPLEAMRRAATNYRKAGGRRKFSEYYTAQDGRAVVSPALRKNVVFAGHNLATDASFNEFQLVYCGEAMRDFDPILQARVHDLLYASLAPRGLLVLRRSNALDVTLHQADYEPLDTRRHIYRRKW